MRKFVIAASLGFVVIACTSGARAEVSDENAADITKTAHAGKSFRVYNPAVNFEQFTKDLTLTSVQQKEIKPILEDLEKQLLPFQKLSLQRKGKRGAPVVEEYYQKIRELLESEQLAIFNDKVSSGEITPFTR
jgi:hypothetical protein